ncbi:hypothetical protein Y697_00100 [Mesotoga sp. BH458_6_3_2_1]|nr:hypothetical protein [Thermotogota bacterium]NLT46556.1 hypothetical protein [Thermotogaceae bacterium]RLL82934.1 hypothetical protein Y697_00100 [Mesotoga sp. BH458_6_3_2_1]
MKADWLLNDSRGSDITYALGLLGGEPLTVDPRRLPVEGGIASDYSNITSSHQRASLPAISSPHLSFSQQIQPEEFDRN